MLTDNTNFSVRSKIVFKTAGVLLDEMREKGIKALKYKVIVLDEVHERSVESDLVLVCIKQFLLRNNGLRFAIFLPNLRNFLYLYLARYEICIVVVTSSMIVSTRGSNTYLCSRVVLMSATADISRYREYFKDLGRGEKVEVLAIPSAGKNTIFQRKVLYLEQVLHASSGYWVIYHCLFFNSIELFQRHDCKDKYGSLFFNDIITILEKDKYMHRLFDS